MKEVSDRLNGPGFLLEVLLSKGPNRRTSLPLGAVEPLFRPSLLEAPVTVFSIEESTLTIVLVASN